MQMGGRSPKPKWTLGRCASRLLVGDGKKPADGPAFY